MTTHASTDTQALAQAAAPEERVASVAPRARTRAAGYGVLAALVALACSVFWAFPALPFQDLPAHAGLIALRERLPSSEFEQGYYVLAPHLGPYSLFRAIGSLAARVLGPLGAVRLLATLPTLATPAAMLFARRRLFGDRSATYGFVGLGLSFGLMTLLGFASYLLGVSVLLVSLVLWLDGLADDDEGRPGAGLRALRMTAASTLLFVAHGHAFVLFLLLAAVTSLARGVARRTLLLRVRALVALAPAVGLAAWVAWLEHGTTTPAGSVAMQAHLEPHFQTAFDKFTLLVTPTLMTRTGVDFVAGVLVWVFTAVAIVATLRSVRRATATRADGHARALLVAAGALSALFLVLPHTVGWFGFVDGRLVPLVLALPLLALRRSRLGPALAAVRDRGAPLLAGAVVATALFASWRFQREAAGFDEVAARIPARTRLLNLPLDPNSDVVTAHPFVHWDKLVLIERPVVLSDVWFHQGTALYPTPQNPALGLPASYRESDLRTVEWGAYDLAEWDYVLVRTRPAAAAPGVPSTLALEAHAGGWWLFRVTDAARARAGTSRAVMGVEAPGRFE